MFFCKDLLSNYISLQKKIGTSIYYFQKKPFLKFQFVWTNINKKKEMTYVLREFIRNLTFTGKTRKRNYYYIVNCLTLEAEK